MISNSFSDQKVQNEIHLITYTFFIIYLRFLVIIILEQNSIKLLKPQTLKKIMSQYGLTFRGRAMSHASIRKRLIRSSSQQHKQLSKNTTAQSFRPKLERLIQENKIEHIMNTDPHTKANIFYTTHVNQMEKQLASAKKSLSTMVMKTKSKQYSINKLKNDIAKIERDQGILRTENDINKNKLTSMANAFTRKQDNLQQRAWMEKSYQYMKSRIDKDQQFLKVRHAQNDRYFKQLQHERKVLDNNLLQLTQFNLKLEYNLAEAKKISKQQTDDKNQFISLLNMEMAQKDMLNDLKIEKVHREGEIKDLMPSVIEKEQLQKYMQIFYTHRVLDRIIKTKSEKLIGKYSKVQNAYMNIKSNTNIVELSKVLARMQSQDHQYENLLRKVDNLQKQLMQIEKDMKKLEQKEHKILSMDNEDKKPSTIKYQGVEKDAYQMLVREKTKLIDRKSQDDILKKKIVLWVQEHAALFQVSTKIRSEEDFFNQLRVLQASMKKKLQVKK